MVETDSKEPEKLYKIIRYFRDEKTSNKIVKKNVTLQEAKDHCNNATTKKTDVYFDSFTEM